MFVWVGTNFQNAQNPNLQPSSYNPELDYSEGTLVSFPDKSLGDSDVREFRAVKAITKGQAPNLAKKNGLKPIPTITKKEKNFSLPFNVFNATQLTELG